MWGKAPVAIFLSALLGLKEKLHEDQKCLILYAVSTGVPHWYTGVPHWYTGMPHCYSLSSGSHFNPLIRS
jgi:hypothetical protein